MKAKELRIGNLVKRNNIVVVCDFMSISDCYQLPDEYEPIPLTEEWLVRFGWEKSGEWFYKDYYEINLNGIFNPSDAHYTIHNDIKYVHQLQNLYFALTGEELTTN